jgi:hypothetical protein
MMLQVLLSVPPVWGRFRSRSDVRCKQRVSIRIAPRAVTSPACTLISSDDSPIVTDGIESVEKRCDRLRAAMREATCGTHMGPCRAVRV